LPSGYVSHKFHVWQNKGGGATKLKCKLSSILGSLF
jgi:hypothetical protein